MESFKRDSKVDSVHAVISATVASSRFAPPDKKSCKVPPWPIVHGEPSTVG
jgi:hypothetical protein